MSKSSNGGFAGPERRRHARHRSDLPARIVMARDNLVFCETRDVSEGGACVRRPQRFRVTVGELVVLAGGGVLGAGRNARIVNASDCLIHCAFEL
ncbi:MAG TPA: PilZ domain-containing protein [Candidatus Sulfotelmatobacter sp.]|nr:PilZ domain-containing protein [Candidatus Sulfotelmatobacter sp.]